jgi:hypothetical protein
VCACSNLVLLSVDLDEVECIVATLIYRRMIKGKLTGEVVPMELIAARIHRVHITSTTYCSVEFD